VPSTTTTGGTAVVPCSHAGWPGQTRSHHARQHAHNPKSADAIHRPGYPQPRPGTHAQTAQCSDPPAQASLHLNGFQPQLVEDPAAHSWLVETGHQGDSRNAPCLGPSHRTRLILDQLLGPLISPTCRHRRADQARSRILPAFQGLTQDRLAAVREVTDRVQRERHAMRTASRLPKPVTRACLPMPPARTVNPAVPSCTGQALLASVRHPRRHHPAGFITTVLDDDESRPGRTPAGRGTLLQLASALRGRACWLQPRSDEPAFTGGLVVLLAALYCHPACNHALSPLPAGAQRNSGCRAT
jgi:hypothetical protein